LREVEVILDREIEGRRLADAADLHRVLIGEAVGCVLGRRVRYAVEQLLAPRLCPAQLFLQSLQLDLDLLELGELFRGRLAFQLPLGA